jgi:hypothetical protein
MSDNRYHQTNLWTENSGKYPQYRRNMIRKGKNMQYDQRGYQQARRDPHLNGSESYYTGPEFPGNCKRFGVMNGNPNSISKSLNRETSNSYNHHPHIHQSNNQSPAFDLSMNHQTKIANPHAEAIHNIPHKREQLSFRGNTNG